MLSYGIYGLFVCIQAECDRGSFLGNGWFGKLPDLGSGYSTIFVQSMHGIV